MLNLIVLTGNLGKEPTTNYTQQGDCISSFDFAFSSNKDNSGWIKVKCFKQVAETVQNHLSKGDQIIVSGKLVEEKWENNGKPRKQLVIHAYSLEFINVKSQNRKPANAA